MTEDATTDAAIADGELNTQPSGSTPSPILLELWASEYSEFHALTALSAELPQPLWVAKRAASHSPAVLADLQQGSERRSAALAYENTTTIQIPHFGVPEVIDARSPEAENPFVAWSVEGGHSLRSSLADGEYPNQRKVLELGRSLAETLAELHRFDHVVGGLTPAAIWRGPAGVTQIIGLGLHHFHAGSIRGEGLRYRAPEQLRTEPMSMAQRILASDLRERADIWALGMVLLELVEHRPRLRCQEPSELLAEINDANLAPGASNLSGEVKSLLEQMLQPDVEQRTITADEISEQLDDLLNASSQSVARGTDKPDPPVPIPKAGHWKTANANAPSQADDWSWRSAVRTVQERRQMLDQVEDISTWKLWLLPALGLGLIGLMLFVLLRLI